MTSSSTSLLRRPPVDEDEAGAALLRKYKKDCRASNLFCWDSKPEQRLDKESLMKVGRLFFQIPHPEWLMTQGPTRAPSS